MSSEPTLLGNVDTAAPDDVKAPVQEFAVNVETLSSFNRYANAGVEEGTHAAGVGLGVITMAELPPQPTTNRDSRIKTIVLV